MDPALCVSMASVHCDQALHCCGSAGPALDCCSPPWLQAGPLWVLTAHSCSCEGAFRRIRSDISPLILAEHVPTGSWAGSYPEESLQLLFFLSAHTPTLLGQRWVFLPTSSCAPCAHAGKTIGCLVVCPLSLEGASCSQQQRLWSVLV